MALFDAIDRIRASLDYHLARQNVLTANLAHIDTPGYRPLDLERRPFQKVLDASIEGHPLHVRSDNSPETRETKRENYRVFVDRSVSPALDGNGVSLDREAVKTAANQLRYDAVASLGASQLSSIIWAATDGGRSGG